ncbi:uncharacterized protein STEHIDRAFT_151799 [Stereum hirsutum FP-91666 SS1]|uniref:uncharacterized protein n=1 Tax=Stereum hirsutum (strain FP-91666) TaxID=721885 RepID=UPI000440E586|nr:uncharacterized protein STEHIDRAFT_151799 [Stereum hirsutum FP-91666 SS1]EIM92477.1 hypothetical protein STEHIDRAFT_151799 [Stereum hirsutum FP-91666 SS1]
MTVIPRILAVFAIVASATATSSKSNSGSSSSCSSNEFWFSFKSCCLAAGTTYSKGSAPSEKTCPTSSGNWYWSDEKSCCLPQSEPEDDNPSCPSTHEWDSGNSCCNQKRDTTTTVTSSTHTTSTHTTSTPTSSAPATTGSSTCSNSEFWFEPKSCCLTPGSSDGKGSPPSGKSCPTSDGDWYWSNNKSCCLPKTKPSAPTPTCSSGWSWDHSNSCCSGGGSSTTTSSNPGPSQKSHKKRSHASRGSTLCPTGLDACPIKGALGLSSDYECIDTTQELESCGGCASTGAGQDCTAIEGAWNVACNAGACAVYNCMSGYRLAADKSSCVAL